MGRMIGKLEQQAYDRHEADLKRQGTSGFPFRYYPEAAQRAVDFFQKHLKHGSGEWAGQPFILSDWEKFIVRMAFGWLRPDGSRRYRYIYIQVARKNGKTEFAAGLLLAVMFLDNEAGSECYTVATKRDQAKICWEAARRMILQSPVLRQFSKPMKTSIVVEDLWAKIEPLSADYNTLDGLNTHGAVLDEIHQHRDSGLWDVIDTSTGARRSPLMIGISTAGAGMAGVAWDLRKHGVEVLDPEDMVTDDAFLFYICEPDEGDDWKDSTTWQKGNPNLGISVKEEQIAEKCQRAQDSPRNQNAFRRLHCNEWTEQVERFIDLDVWDQCAGPVGWSELPEHLSGRRCYAGIDLSTSIDLTALVLAFPDPETEKVALIADFWLPMDSLRKRVEKDKVPYDTWRDLGLLHLTPGNVIDYDYILQSLLEKSRLYEIPEICYDPYLALQFALRAQEEGLPMIEHRQGVITMNEPTRAFERLILSRKLEHGGNPVLRWMAGNVAVTENATGLLKPDKKVSTERIDGIVAGIMAVGRAAIHPENGQSIWDTEEQVV